MLSLYVDGDGLLHRARPGVKIVLVLVVVLAISLLPTAWWALAPAVLAPVLAQPSLPLNDPAGMHIAPDELAAVKARPVPPVNHSQLEREIIRR